MPAVYVVAIVFLEPKRENSNRIIILEAVYAVIVLIKMYSTYASLRACIQVQTLFGIQLESFYHTSEL